MQTSFMHSLKKHPGILLVSLLIIFFLVWGFWPKAPLVDASKARIAPMAVTIKEDGKTRLIDRYSIAAPVNGMTCKMHLKVGQYVNKDQTLLSISPLPAPVLDARARAAAQQKVASAKAALSSAKQQANASQASASQAALEAQRLKPLLTKGLISQDQYDKAKTLSQSAQANLRSAQFQVDVAKHELEAALTTLQYSNNSNTDDLEHLEVTSPIDGQILKVSRECQGPVSIGEVLLEVGNPDALEVEVDLLSADAVKLEAGMKVIFKRWGGEHDLQGRVKLIEPVGFTKVSALGVEEQRVWVIVEFTSPLKAWQRLGDGYRVEAEFILWQQDQVLQVPSSAVFRHQSGWAVFAIKDSVARLQNIQPGKRNGLWVEVISGLENGHQVINHPNDKIEDGTKVKIYNVSNAE